MSYIYQLIINVNRNFKNMKKNYILFLIVTLFAFTVNAQVTLTQSIDDITVSDSGVACWAAGASYSDNAFLRAYDLADFGISESFDITSVEYGQGSAFEGKIITCNIYTATTDNLATALLTLVGTADHVSEAAADLSLISVPLSVTIPAGSIIAFEVFAGEDPDDGDPGTDVSAFFPGINDVGENDDSWIMSVDCGLTAPTTATSIGFADNQYVMNIVGNILNVEEFSLENSVSIFPNPTSDIISIDVSDRINVNTLELYDILGKQVIKSSKNTSAMDLSDLSAGVYMLRINTDSGTLTKKVVRD